MGLDDLIFGKKRTGDIPSLDVAPLKERLSRSTTQRKGILGETSRQLTPLTEQFRTGTLARGEQFVGDIGARGQQFTQQIANPALRAAFRDRLARESFANVPALQQQIRQQIGGGGLAGNAAARARLADPALAAAGDVGRGQVDFDLMQDQARRQALRDVFQTDVGALGTQFGTDIGAEESALGMSREDILREQGGLSGLISEETTGLNELDLLQQQAAISRARAMAEESARRSGTRRGLFSSIAAPLLGKFLPSVGEGLSNLRNVFSPQRAEVGVQ